MIETLAKNPATFEKEGVLTTALAPYLGELEFSNLPYPSARVDQHDKIESIIRERETTDSRHVARRLPAADAPLDTVPIQIWEGKVVELSQQTLTAVLTDKTGGLPAHTAEISLEWVSPQDMELVIPGAIFYLSLYKEILNRTVRNWEEIRFRRLPSWSAKQLETIRREAEGLLARLGSTSKPSNGKRGD